MQRSLLLFRYQSLAIVRPSRCFSTSPLCLRQPTKSSKQFTFGKLEKFFEPTKDRKWMERNLRNRLNKFTTNSDVKKKSRGLGIKNDLFKVISKSFVSSALKGKIPRISASELLSNLNDDNTEEYIDKMLLSAFLSYAEPHLPEEIVERFNSLKKISDLRFPSEWFPEARQMRRKIFLHVGPTNSGKTYRALKRLEGAESGIYCGPLRLLAHEIFDKMNDKGIACNLLTGEERKEVAPYAPLTSSTVEMATLSKTLDVAVIDEIQMIADSDRGWAWTQALLGLKAKEIHLCGEASAVPLVKKICETLDEEVVVNEYDRLTPFTVLDESLNGDLSTIRKGDCVVSFSRKDIFSLRDKIEAQTGLKCAVAYGGLPPETRALQAKEFNDPNSGFNVLVASDAVGMGLNLNIKRIIFSTVKKYNGKGFINISIPQLKQIAGRAGRFGTAYSDGEVTTLYPDSLDYVRECVNSPIIPLEMAGLQPTVDIIELFALQMPEEKFSGLLQKFEDLASLNGDYFLCNYDDQKTIADLIEDIKLPLRDRYQFVTAPVSTRSEPSKKLIKVLARKMSENESCTLDDVIQLPKELTMVPKELETLEGSHKNIMLYMWLSVRYPDIFTSTPEYALKIKTRCEALIDESLKKTSLKLKAKKKGIDKQLNKTPREKRN